MAVIAQTKPPASGGSRSPHCLKYTTSRPDSCLEPGAVETKGGLRPLDLCEHVLLALVPEVPQELHHQVVDDTHSDSDVARRNQGKRQVLHGPSAAEHGHEAAGLVPGLQRCHFLLLGAVSVSLFAACPATAGRGW